jgi:hypothetical protein
VGVEAYTVRMRAVRIQLRNRFIVAMPTLLAWRKAVSVRIVDARGHRVAGVYSPGHAFRGASQEPRRALYLFVERVRFTRPKRTRPGAGVSTPAPGAKKCSTEKPDDQGRPEESGTGREQSYELMVPMKVGNRRAPARGGHGTHWRDGANKRTDR